MEKKKPKAKKSKAKKKTKVKVQRRVTSFAGSDYLKVKFESVPNSSTKLWMLERKCLPGNKELCYTLKDAFRADNGVTLSGDENLKWDKKTNTLSVPVEPPEKCIQVSRTDAKKIAYAVDSFNRYMGNIQKPCSGAPPADDGLMEELIKQGKLEIPQMKVSAVEFLTGLVEQAEEELDDAQFAVEQQTLRMRDARMKRDGLRILLEQANKQKLLSDMEQDDIELAPLPDASKE